MSITQVDHIQTASGSGCGNGSYGGGGLHVADDGGQYGGGIQIADGGGNNGYGGGG